jgi:uncharacterized protein YjbJ (UPF0337 family)
MTIETTDKAIFVQIVGKLKEVVGKARDKNQIKILSNTYR